MEAERSRRLGMSIPSFRAESARKLLDAPRPWTADDFVCAGLFFRDYGERLLGVLSAAKAVSVRFQSGEVLLTREQRRALEDLELELGLLDL